MGFWGAFVVHQGESLLTELLPDVDEARRAELSYDGIAGGWQVTRLFIREPQLPDDFTTRLRAATGAPVLVAAIMDSSYGFVVALSSGSSWQAWLHLGQAIGYLYPAPAPFDEDDNFLGSDWTDPEYELQAAELKARMLADVPGGAVAAPAAVAWAREAGLEPASVDAIAATLEGDEGTVEGRFFDLLARLGIATADELYRPARPPAIADVLRSLFGHTLDTLGFAPHLPFRGEYLRQVGSDLYLRFDGQRLVQACACTGEFALRPVSGHAADFVPIPVDAGGRRLVNAATIRQGVLPNLCGTVLRFDDDQALFVAVLHGEWTVAKGTTPPQELVDRLGPGYDEQVRFNAWIDRVVAPTASGVDS